VRLPNSEKSRAVIVGTSLYQPDSGFEPLPTVTRNLGEIADFLRTHTGLRHVQLVENPAHNAAIIDAVRPAVQNAEDLLLFYYSGHGVPLGTGDVGLTHATSRSDGPEWSTLHYAALRNEIRATRAAIKIVILDCCHSGRAFGSGALATTNQNAALRDLVEIEGAYVLTATNSTQKFAKAAGANGCTAFTGALLEVMRTGADTKDQYLTMDSVFPLLAGKLRAAGNPAPRSSGSNNVAGIALATNPSWRARTLIVVDFDNLRGHAKTGSSTNFASSIIAAVVKRFAGAEVAIFVSHPDRELRAVAHDLRADLYHPKGTNRFQSKGLDVQMAVYVTGRIGHLSKLVLVSGDSGFIPVLAAAKNAGTPTVVVGGRETTAKRLIEAADEFLSLSQLDEPTAEVLQDNARAQFAGAHVIGEIVPGTVRKLLDSGVLVRVDQGIDGLMYNSELPPNHIEKATIQRPLRMSSMWAAQHTVQLGDEVMVKIIDIDMERRRILLSLKQANQEYTDEFDPSKYGMWDEYDEHGNYIFPDGFDPKTNEWLKGYEKQRTVWEARYAEAERRHKMHTAQVEGYSWTQFVRTHVIGEIVPGKLTKLLDVGVVVRVGERVEALVDNSELPPDKAKAVNRTMRVGDDVLVKIIEMDVVRPRISLSLKQADQDYTDEFDPSMYGMSDEYDEHGNYIFPEGFDPKTNEWLEGYEKQRAEWKARYAEAERRHKRHTAQVEKFAAAYEFARTWDEAHDEDAARAAFARAWDDAHAENEARAWRATKDDIDKVIRMFKELNAEADVRRIRAEDVEKQIDVAASGISAAISSAPVVGPNVGRFVPEALPARVDRARALARAVIMSPKGLDDLRSKFNRLDAVRPIWFAQLCARADEWSFSRHEDAYLNEIALKSLAVEIADLASDTAQTETLPVAEAAARETPSANGASRSDEQRGTLPSDERLAALRKKLSDMS
jgi:predicted RNA-binding protein with RPS1 domain/uncharacterized LabA/DUF88 family protein